MFIVEVYHAKPHTCTCRFNPPFSRDIEERFGCMNPVWERYDRGG